MIKNLLNKSRSLEDSNKNTTLHVQLSNDKKEAGMDAFTDTVNAYSVYMDERYACNKIRLTAQINLMASNVLFNQITEIVKNEDSNQCVCLNFTPVKIEKSYGKDSQYEWGSNISDCLRDTQITSPNDDNKNYIYHPGIDIFNNHLLRSKNNLPMYYSADDSSITNDFNTINDFIRDINGRKKISTAYAKHGFGKRTYLHLYQKDDIYTFSESLNYRLLDKNGWLGFLNKSAMPVFDSNGNDIGISKVLNNEQANKYVYMYPGKEYYDLLPYYNSSRNRKEKNWEYCLTYPSSSTTKGISCINEDLGTLKIAFIDENETDDDDIRRTVIYSACKHGLAADDIINIYRTKQDNSISELVEKEVVVDTVIDDYTFAVYLGEPICKEWISVFDQKAIDNKFGYYDKNEGYYVVCDTEETDDEALMSGTCISWSAYDSPLKYIYFNIKYRGFASYTTTQLSGKTPTITNKKKYTDKNQYFAFCDYTIKYWVRNGIKYTLDECVNLGWIIDRGVNDVIEGAVHHVYEKTTTDVSNEYFILQYSSVRVGSYKYLSSKWTTAETFVKNLTIHSDWVSSGVVKDGDMDFYCANSDRENYPNMFLAMYNSYIKTLTLDGISESYAVAIQNGDIIKHGIVEIDGASYNLYEITIAPTDYFGCVVTATFTPPQEDLEISGLTTYAFNGYINADFDTDDRIGSQNLSFARVVNNEECDYYVRIFSRLPNFNFMEGDINEETIYKEYMGSGELAIDKFSTSTYAHQCVLSKLAYAKNIYNDNIYQMVFNDDICFDYIKDNLGRPLSSIYLSFFKTSYGHKDWYNGNVKSDNVEHSHCFGKVNCGFDLSPYIRRKQYWKGNTRLMNNCLEGYEGLSQLVFRDHKDNFDDDEISFMYQKSFYGDLCEFSPGNCNEKVIQPIMHRFNTQQRELKNSGYAMNDKFESVIYDNIIYDDFDKEADFLTTTYTFDNNPTNKKEGYVYQSSYEIPIRAWSGQLNEFSPLSYGLDNIKKYDSNYIITTSENNYLNLDSELILYDTLKIKSYTCNIINILSPNKILVSVTTTQGDVVTLGNDGIIEIGSYRLFKVPNSIPTYATMATDGSGIYRWRYLYQNGFEDTTTLIDEYPFVNNCLYINKQFNLFIRRQDPFGDIGLVSSDEPTFGITSLTGVKTETSDEDGDNTTNTENDASC